MKKILLIAMICLLSKATFSQDSEWINRVNFEPTEQCLDSVNCYTQVIMEINPEKIPDSAWMWLKIGSEYGSDNIYSKKYQKTDSLTEQPEVAIDDQGIIIINLGSYIIAGDFFVDMSIE
jgi:hypothetical protein